jgi:hypothetical protein
MLWTYSKMNSNHEWQNYRTRASETSAKTPLTSLSIRDRFSRMVEPPGKDASAAEIAEWMEEDFWEGAAESIRSAVEDAEDDD